MNNRDSQPSAPPPRIFTERAQILPWLESPEWQVFIEWLDGLQAAASIAVRAGEQLTESGRAIDGVTLFGIISRANGALDVIQTIRNLKAELRRWDREAAAKAAEGLRVTQ